MEINEKTKPIILEYSEQQHCFHYNFMDEVSGYNSYHAISLCSLHIASDFCNNHCPAPDANNLTYDDVFALWRDYCNKNRRKFTEIGMKLYIKEKEQNDITQ